MCANVRVDKITHTQKHLHILRFQIGTFLIFISTAVILRKTKGYWIYCIQLLVTGQHLSKTVFKTKSGTHFF